MDSIAGVFNGARFVDVGGAGFVGSNLVRRIISQNQDGAVTVVDNLLYVEKENITVDTRV